VSVTCFLIQASRLSGRFAIDAPHMDTPSKYLSRYSSHGFMFFRGRGKEISRRGITLFVNADVDVIWQSNNDKFILPK